jgi:signal transduction histidine kinase
LAHKLEQDKKELVDLDRMKDEFLQMATHELNTPITVIQGKMDMAIREDYVHLDKEQKDYFQTVMTDTERLAHLSKDILNTARIDQHRLTINRSETDLNGLIVSIVDGFQIKAQEKGITVEYIKPEKALPKLTIDQSKIGEVITNLINNAIKFTEKGGITVIAKQEDGYVIISVQDTGIGMEKEDQKHLFEKFYQVGRFDPDNPKEQQGTGLGLYISKNIIELHGGKIWLESEKEKGSTFYFSLPEEYKECKAENGKLHCSEDQVRVL